MLVPGVDPVSVTEDAQPVQAIRNAARATASTHAIQRMSPQTETVAEVFAERRPNRVARTRTGTFAQSLRSWHQSRCFRRPPEAARGKARAFSGHCRPRPPTGCSQRPSTPALERAAREDRAVSASPSQTPRLGDVGNAGYAPTAGAAAKVRRTRGAAARRFRPRSHRKARR